MVLLNGVKYACERCIRGHRVSSCSHTDKPLMMIKPKGRPASQCMHCREQRKVKNVHVLCNCGKKGKSPGQHLASCPCHKNSHCTCVCVTKDKKQAPHAAKRKNSPAAVALDLGEACQNNVSEHVKVPYDLDFLIEDSALPFETSSGLLDYFLILKLPPFAMPEDSYVPNGQFAPLMELGLSQLAHSGSGDSQQHQESNIGTEGVSEGYTSHGKYETTQAHQPQSEHVSDMNYFPRPPSDTDLDLMENMLPLFPLVGFNSFEDDKSLPLLNLPEQSPNLHEGQILSHNAERPNRGVALQDRTDGRLSTQSRNRITSTQPSDHSNLHSSLQSSVSLQNMNMVATHHPRPLKTSSSFSVGYLNNRPKRSESVLSAGSTSSNTSKHNLFEMPHMGQHDFPKTSSSAAFPPFNLTDNNSKDDFQHMNFNSPGLYNENRLLPIVSDEELSKSGHLSGNVTPQSSIPSRQLLQTRRKTSLSRSHLLIHHTAVAKEHFFFLVKAGSSAEISPREVFERKLGGHDDSLAQVPTSFDTYIREVAEETLGLYPIDTNAMPPSTNIGLGVQQLSGGQASEDYNLQHPEFSLIPMYQELFDQM